MIELVGGAHPAHPQLMLWDGSKDIIAPAIEHNGRAYKATPIENSILQQLMLPTHCCPHGTTRSFWQKLAVSSQILSGWMKSLLPSQLESCSAAQ